MNTLNHLATGAAIALAIDNPFVVLPLAFLSHFALDALPHFGFQMGSESGYAEALKHKWLSIPSLAFDVVGIVVLIWLLVGQTWYVFIATILAVSPDFVWPYRYLVFEKKGIQPPKADALTQFHLNIQWCERPWGLITEIPYALGAVLLVSRLV